ncbi:MAG: 30S ribosomal protein S27e [Candidatus Hodarchaeales archaeon]|jgi:small subunit ribosomal protein S27e
MQRNRKPSRFLQVKCEKCENEQIIFSHAKSSIKCRICDEIIAEPTGGKAQLINATVLNTLS